MATSKAATAFFRPLHKLENWVGVIALGLMAFLPVLELILRTFFNTGITGSTEYVQHLALWVGFLGAMLTSREGRHLSLSEGVKIFPERFDGIAKAASSLVSTAVAAGLFWASYNLVGFEMASPQTIGGLIPVWVAESILPISFGFITLRFIWNAGGPKAQILAALGIPLAYVLGFPPELFGLDLEFILPSTILWPAVGLLIFSALLGAPIFVVLGGAALMFFYADFVPVASIPAETYRLVTSPSIPAIPLFTLAGFILAESRASERLVRLFRALFGWMPGGLVVATTLVCAFFSTFTGASGVTILALGGLLLPVLLKGGYKDRFSTGLITSTGSIGLLFPPSLAVILYGVVARVPIDELFLAGVVPGIIMVMAVVVYGVWQGRGGEIDRPPFNRDEALRAIWQAKWEILLPVIVLFAIFGGFTSLMEAAAITAVYAIITQVFIHKDLKIFQDVPGIFVKCLTMLGGIFVILGVAMGLTNYLVDAMIPMQAADWVEANVDSKITFLLALNVFLLVVGAMMDIFSAIVVVVPLIVPIATIFGIHPLHLGMIFLVNLELGYLTPPVGMNLFLASYRLDKPLVEVYRAALPFLLVLAAVVLLITYVPELIIGVE
ncbi:MAG: TRAP transporter large permease subunit [Sphingomonadales bacterium]